MWYKRRVSKYHITQGSMPEGESEPVKVETKATVRKGKVDL